MNSSPYNKKLAYATSPFVILQSHDTALVFELQKKTRLSSISTEVYDALWYFIHPHTLAEAKKAGIRNEVCAVCIKEKLLILEREYQKLSIWEKSNWTRAAYTTFSQLNLEYADVVHENLTQKEYVAERRRLMDRYSKLDSYPIRYKPKGLHSSIPIVAPQQNHLDLDAIKNRRSVRSFSDEPIPRYIFESILYNSTQNVRLAKQSQKSGDLLFILNSFYAWLFLYVYIQNVDGMCPGLYFYDVETSDLYFIHDGINNANVAHMIQGQNWIGGGGFCIFIGVDWLRYAWIYRHSRAYLNLLIQVGEISEEFILSSYQAGLGCWITPAVTESEARSLFKIDNQNVDILLFMKHGMKK